MSVLSGATYAQQSDNKVQSLGDILNPKIGDYKENLSVDERGNIYFSKCMATESLAFDVEEKELLCACTSAKLGDIITGPEFVSLYKDTKKGETARLKVITYAYTKCIDYAIREKIYKDCRVLPVLKSIKYGKKNICECTANHYERLLTNGAAHLIMEGIKYAPMTLNPMERYFTTNAYYNTLSKYAKACRSQMLYDRHN
ncbi:MAG: hypothetical protein KAJ29_07940 [Alphaproteobacteria bacterium]|nr:hypothetical protein [Alphaproteobacteria bacterium]